MTSTDTNTPAATERPTFPNTPYEWNIMRLFQPLSSALLCGLRDGLITDDDLPPIPAKDCEYSVLAAWWRDVYSAADAKGVLDAYRRGKLLDAVPAACPPWCDGKDHPEVIASDDAVFTRYRS